MQETYMQETSDGDRWICPCCGRENGSEAICPGCGFDGSTDYLAYPTLVQMPQQEKTAWQRVEKLETKVQRLLAEVQDCVAEVRRLKAELRTGQPEMQQPIESAVRRRREEQPDRKCLGVLKKYGHENSDGLKKDELSFDRVTPKKSIRVIQFLNTLSDAPKDAVDCSEAQDGSVLCWTVGSVQYIAGEGGVSAGNSCAYLFSDYTKMTAIRFAGHFDTSKATDLGMMFSGCSSLAALDLSGFDTSNVTDMQGMFFYCKELMQVNVSGWNTASVTEMNHMFSSCKSLSELDLSGWDTSNVKNMGLMFGFCTALTTLNLSGWNTANVTEMYAMFCGCTALTEFDPSWLNTTAADTAEMYAGTPWEKMRRETNSISSRATAQPAQKQPARPRSGKGGKLASFYSFDTGCSLDRVTPRSNITEIRFLNTLANAPRTAADISEKKDRSVLCWTKGTVLYIAGEGGVIAGSSCAHLFSGYKNVTAIQFDGNFDTSNVNDMSYLFYSCNALQTVDLSGWDTSRVTNMSRMFGYCSALRSLDLSGWNTASVTDMSHLFQNCKYLETLDLSGWDTAKAWDMSWMFAFCGRLHSFRPEWLDTARSDTTGMYTGTRWE